ncbi:MULTISPECIES: efflux RND transporter periplasmic adaptor subunit [unclassified Duganella]|uniref:efflux RND transporter periplasmic adaptor subunit n=1 Tax=unclassified Duganella TaxID=2636909 RepID=UPI00088D7317|nr:MULTISPECIES: efflux RND transporter periplasmic adaptor subunit [unclassified Duganella]SDG01579.1 RND family efflux transporter, MFP subunit [Duganella sp. OV458]SDJ03607.1 RND family efflux transporter, MFP subunit [Duganella sp. OV510]
MKHVLSLLSLSLLSLTLSSVLPLHAAPQPAAPAAGALDSREIRAQLAPRRYTTLAAEIGAKINRLPLAEGASFRQGQLLVQFDCVLQQAQLAKADAALMAAETNWKGNQKLAQLNSVGQVELDVSKAEAQKAQAEVAANRALLGKCSIAAPFSGRIAEQKAREQQYVQPGQALMEILDDSQLELEFIVPSRWLAWVRSGAPFQVSIDETGKTYPAKVQRIGARVDPVSQSVKLSAVIDGRFGELVAGMSGKVLMVPPPK